MGLYDLAADASKRYRRGWPKAKKAVSRGAEAQSLELVPGRLSVTVAGWLSILRRGIVSGRNKLLSTLNNRNAYQVGRTFCSRVLALANVLPRYLILLSRQGKVVSAACELERGRS
jgi:hypothetical protein